ncbi:MAG: ligand-binding sensor domain-containing diguanylate cyclase [Thermotogota bacterium]
MKKIKILIFLLIISFSFSSQKIQNYPFYDNYSNLNITQIYQDHYDFLWLGTDYGIYRFDGDKSKSFFPNANNSKSLKGEKINYIFGDSSQNLWIATNLGLNLFNYSKDSFDFYHNENMNNHFLSVAEFDDSLLIGTSSGLLLFDKNDESFQKVSENLDIFTINDIDIHETSFWLSTNKGLVKYNQKNDDIEIYSSNKRIKKSVLIDDTFWYITDKGLHKYDIKNATKTEFLDFYEFNSLTINKKELWLSTNSNKIIKFNSNSLNYEIIDLSSSIYYIYKDKYDFIWISNKKYGLSRMNINSPFENISFSLKENLSSISIDNDNFIWLGNNDGNLKRFNPFSDNWEEIETDLNTIKYLSDNGTSLILGTNNGLFSLNKKDFSINQVSTKNLSITSILENSNNEFWIGSDNGLFLLKNNSLKILIENISINKIIKDKDSLWIIDNKNKVIKYEIFTEDTITYEDIFIETIKINNFIKINNNLYFSSNHGIVKYDLESYDTTYLDIDDGLASNNIKTLTMDTYGNIWASTDRGISKFFVFENRFLNYDLDDGVIFNNFIEGKHLNYNNQIYFLSKNGITNFYINDVKTNIRFHPIIISSIETEDQKHFLTSSKELKIKDNSFKIQFLSADFNNEIQYRYKLLNFDEEWKYTSQNSIYFSMLPQGEYKFIIQTVDNSGKWVGKEKILNLKVSYSIFKTRYAFAFYIISILSFISIFIYFTFLKQKSKYETKTKQLIRQHIEESQENSNHLEKLNKRIEKLSSYDPLTGIQNLRLFDEIVEREWNLAKRKKYPLTLILIDLDYFKNYNDEYGHLKGDEVLIDVAQSLKKCLRRATDHVFRYSGEKFAAVLPDTDEPGAKVVAYNMKNAVDKLNIPHIKSKVSDHITVSIGTSTRTPSDQMDIETFISETESSLIDAKNKGRDNIVQHSDKEPGDS